MLTHLIILSVAVSVAFSACTLWPNGTDVKERWWSCPARNMIYNMTPYDTSGAYEYPVHLGRPLIVQITFDNQDHVYPVGSLRDDVNIWSWGGNLGCSWHPIPTLGLTANQDSCAHGLPCPVQMGRQTLPLTVDFTPFQAIIDLLKDDAPYQLQYVLKDHANGDRVVSCAYFQSRCRIH